MNKKNSNSWILCQSKTFPGKLYYFNVVTGEAAWSFNEFEAKFLKKDTNIPKTPVNPVCNSMVNTWIPQSPMFTQAFNSNYILQPTPYIPNVMWTQLPLTTQMCTSSGPQLKKQMSHQITQTQEVKEKTLVQATGMTMSERFFSYCNTNKKTYNFRDVVTTSSDYNYNRIENSFCFDNDKKKSVSEKITSQCNHRFPLPTVKYELSNGTFPNKISPKRSEIIFFKQDNDVTSCEKSTEMEINSFNSYETNSLDSSDLRLKLIAMKNNRLNIQHICNRQVKGDGGNIIVDAKQAQAPPKKRVSLKLYKDDSKETCSVIRDVKLNTVCTNQTATCDLVNIQTMKNLRKAHMSIEVWFVMADLNVLLNDFQFIDNFVRQDESCRLAIPYGVLTMIKELSTLNQKESKSVWSSRSILRRLMDSPHHITLLESMRNGDVSISKQILDCCIKLLERNYHVVLVTTVIELFTNGKAANLHCFMLQQIDDRDLIFRYNNKDFSSSPNDNCNATDHCGGNENLFLQKPNEFQPFVVDNKPEIIENRCFRVQNIERGNVKSFKKVIRNDLCKEVINFEPTPRVLNEKYNLNSRKIIDSDTSGNIKIHRIISNVVENGMHSKSAAESFKTKVNQQFHLKDTIPNQMIKNNNRQINYNLTNEQNDPEDVSCNEPNVSGENTVPCRKQFKIYFDKQQATAESKCNLETSKESMDTLNEKLKKFYVKNKVMLERIKTRGEEWMCCFTQLTENCMLHVLLEMSTSYPVYPCTIPEAAGRIGKLFKHNNLIEAAANGLSALYNSISPNGKLKANFNPDDLVKTIGCGMLLVESLKASIPRSQLLIETEYSLIHLLYCVEDPKSDAKSLEFINTPTFSRGDDDEDIIVLKSTYVKKSSEVLAYLKKHFPEWKTYDEEFIEDDLKKENSRSANVVRTVGRRLNMLKINSFNKMILSPDPKCDSELISINKCITEKDSLDDTAFKSSNAFNKITSNTDRQMKCPIPVSDFDHLLKHNDAYVTHEPAGPSGVINVKVIEDFKDKLMKKPLKNNVRQFHVLKKNNTSSPRKGFNEHSKCVNIPDGISEIFSDIAYPIDINNKMAETVKAMSSDVSKDDSGLGNENCPEHTIFKSFLIELSCSLNIIYKFINESIAIIKGRSLKEENKKALREKTDKTYKFLLVIVDKLKSIIEREPDGDTSTVKSLLIKAGVDVANDKRVSRYKQVVTKCLEQANLLRLGLKLLLNVTNDNFDSESLVSELYRSNVCYFNIFE